MLRTCLSPSLLVRALWAPVFTRSGDSLLSPQRVLRTPCLRSLATHRRFSRSAIRCQTTAHEPIKDPTHPSLFYHVFETTEPLTYALSFSGNAPLEKEHASILGWLPIGDNVSLDDFEENPNFRSAMHKAIQDALVDGSDDVWINGALQLQSGWMHIHDNRNIPALGRIGNIEDIIGTVRVDDSKIIANTYEPNPSYRICTTDGMTQLTAGLAKKFANLVHD